MSASVKITLLQKPAFSAVHNCNSTEMPQMQNTVFLLYLHSWYTYSNKGGRKGCTSNSGQWGSEKRMKKCSACVVGVQQSEAEELRTAPALPKEELKDGYIKIKAGFQTG